MLACIGRADAAPGRSNLARWRSLATSTVKRKECTTSELDLLKAVDSHVQVQHNVAAVRDEDLVPYILQSLVLQFLELLEETRPVHSISIAVDDVQNIVRLATAHDSKGPARSQAVVGKGGMNTNA